MSSIQGAKNYSKYLHVYLNSQNKQGTAKDTLWYHKTNICPKTLISLKEQTSEFAKLKFLSAFYLIIKTLRCLEGYGLWHNPMLSWQKIICFREWKESIVFISVSCKYFSVLSNSTCVFQMGTGIWLLFQNTTFNKIRVYWKNRFEKCCNRKHLKK